MDEKLQAPFDRDEVIRDLGAQLGAAHAEIAALKSALRRLASTGDSTAPSSS